MDPALQALIARQDGLVRLSTLHAHGMTRAAVTWRIGRVWRFCLPGVVQTFTGELSPRQSLTAASLYAGDDALLTGWGACRLHGLTNDTGDRRLVFVTPMNRGARSFRHIFVRRSALVEAGTAGRNLPRLVPLARAVADAVCWATDQNLADALVIEAVQRGFTSMDELTHRLAERNRRHSRRLRYAIDQAASGAWSVPEAVLLALLARSSVLPPVVANPHLVALSGQRLVTPDAWIPDVGLALMVHSRRHHFDVADWEATIAGDAGLAMHGITVVGFTPRQIRSDGPGVLRRVEQTYLALRADGRRPRVRSPSTQP